MGSPRVITGAMSTADLLSALRSTTAAQFMLRAKADGCTLTATLEDESPTDPGDRKNGVDVFTRLMEEADIITRADRTAGIQADTMATMLERAGRVLTTEWAWRQYRKAQGEGIRAIASADNAPGGAMRPFFDLPGLTQDMLEPAIPVAELLASEQGIPSNVFRKMVLTEPTAPQKRLVRVGEGGPIPVTQLQVTQGTINMYKFGRGLEITDEARRRERLDRVAVMIALMAIQNENDKAAAILEVLVNGDESGYGAATNYNLTALDSGTSANNLTLKAWMAWLGKWDNPYIATHVLAQEAGALSVKLLNTGSANLRLEVLPPGYSAIVRPINPRINPTVALGQTSDAPSGKLVGFDARVSVERVFEIGAATEENERFANRQTEAIYFTEVEGYQLLNDNGNKTLNLAA